MSRKTLIACAAIGGIVAALSFAEPVNAGTCSPVKAKGEAKKMADATTLAQKSQTEGHQYGREGHSGLD
jgi:hypothetical protein